MFGFLKKKGTNPEGEKLPQHIGIIMDGNGRWAQRRGLPRSAGHKAGARTLKTIVKYCAKRNIPCLTVYAFSTENWKRPKAEVDALMDLLLNYLLDFRNQLEGDTAKIRVIGDLEPFSQEIRDAVAVVERETANNAEITVNIALNYGGRDEIVRAARRLAQEVKRGALQPEEIDAAHFGAQLYTDGCPEVDLIIRPSGEKRLSNFLLWQAAYAEFWYADICWPDFKPRDLEHAIHDFSRRNRRFGGI